MMLQKHYRRNLSTLCTSHIYFHSVLSRKMQHQQFELGA